MDQCLRVVIIGVMLVVWSPLLAMAASKTELDVQVPEALDRFYEEIPTGKSLADKANGILVFPSVVKAGFGIGGEYGEGVLLVEGQIADYYSVASASIGFQLGVQVKTQILLFMNDDALKGFRQSDGWEAGVDASVAVATIGAGGELDTNTAQQPIIGFIFSNKGLMYNLTLEGSKVTKIKK